MRKNPKVNAFSFQVFIPPPQLFHPPPLQILPPVVFSIYLLLAVLPQPLSLQLQLFVCVCVCVRKNLREKNRKKSAKRPQLLQTKEARREWQWMGWQWMGGWQWMNMGEEVGSEKWQWRSRDGNAVYLHGNGIVTPVKKLSSLTMLIQFNAAAKQIELQKRAQSHLKAFKKIFQMRLSSFLQLYSFRRSSTLNQYGS